MEAVSSSETSVSIYQTTWYNNPEDGHLHTCHHENLKSHLAVLCSCVPLVTDLFAREMWSLHWLVGVGTVYQEVVASSITLRGWGNTSSAKIFLQSTYYSPIKHFLDTNFSYFSNPSLKLKWGNLPNLLNVPNVFTSLDFNSFVIKK
jgi:hypothetical protein